MTQHPAPRPSAETRLRRTRLLAAAIAAGVVAFSAPSAAFAASQDPDAPGDVTVVIPGPTEAPASPAPSGDVRTPVPPGDAEPTPSDAGTTTAALPRTGADAPGIVVLALAASAIAVGAGALLLRRREA